MFCLHSVDQVQILFISFSRQAFSLKLRQFKVFLLEKGDGRVYLSCKLRSQVQTSMPKKLFLTFSVIITKHKMSLISIETCISAKLKKQ